MTPACVGKTCASGTVCDSTGTCVDACIGVTCPKGQACTAGKCVAVTGGDDAGVDGGTEPDSGPISFDTGVAPTDDASTGGDGGGTGLGDADTPAASAGSCDVPGATSRGSAAGLIFGFVLLARRRLRSR